MEGSDSGTLAHSFGYEFFIKPPYVLLDSLVEHRLWQFKKTRSTNISWLAPPLFSDYVENYIKLSFMRLSAAPDLELLVHFNVTHVMSSSFLDTPCNVSEGYHDTELIWSFTLMSLHDDSEGVSD